ncbi:MAG: hypothetical protein IKS14_06615 [Thermoguttaceae bacterium]|nr:hypothetical protein [Thermoguttaceae bacterium]
MTKKELDEMEIEARKHVFRHFIPDMDPDKCLKRYKYIANRIPLLVCLLPVLLISIFEYLADGTLPNFEIIKLIIGIIVFWEGVRLFVVWFINNATIGVMKIMIEEAKEKAKEGNTGGNGESDNEGREDNGGFNGS